MTKSVMEELPEILLKEKLVTREQIKEARKVQDKSGGTIAQALLEKGYISDRVLMVCLAERLNVPPVDLSKLRPVAEVVELIPRQIASHYKFIPVARLGNSLSVAVLDLLAP